MSDPLALLKSFYTSKKTIKEKDEVICFGNLCFPRNTKTNYLRMGKTHSNKEYYTLDTILFFLKNIGLPYANYVQKALAQKLQIISFPDSKELGEYFSGLRHELKNIDTAAPIPRFMENEYKSNLKDFSKQSNKYYDETNIDSGYTTSRRDMPISKQNDEAVPELGKIMSADEIAQIKLKRLAHRRMTLQEPDNYVSTADSIIAQENIVSEMQKSRDVHVFYEKNSKTRQTLLQATTKDFTNVLTMLNSLRSNRDNGSLDGLSFLDPQGDKDSRASRREQTGLAYDRYDQERFTTARDTAGFKINTLGSFKGLMTKINSGQSSNSYAPTINSQSVAPPKRESKTPIIIVPSATTSLINIHNITSFIQDFKFVVIDPLRINASLAESHILIQRKREKMLNGQMQSFTVPYICVDNTDRLNGSDWNRVVAVFVHGPTWQFKNWPYILPNNCPSEIFSRIKAFHVKYSDSQPETNISKWNVKILNILRNSRHMDRAAVTSFWEDIDNFISRNKPFLRH